MDYLAYREKRLTEIEANRRLDKEYGQKIEPPKPKPTPKKRGMGRRSDWYWDSFFAGLY